MRMGRLGEKTCLMLLLTISCVNNTNTKLFLLQTVVRSVNDVIFLSTRFGVRWHRLREQRQMGAVRTRRVRVVVENRFSKV